MASHRLFQINHGILRASGTFAIQILADLDTLAILTLVVIDIVAILTLVVIDTLGSVPLVVEGLGFVWTVDGDL